MIKATTIIEIMGKPQEHVKTTLERVYNLIKNNENFKLINHTLSEPKEIQESKEIFTAFGEFDIEFSKIDDVFGFCFDFMPSSIEITEPEQLKLESTSITDFLNDIIAKMHQYDMTLKKYLLKEQAENKN